MAISFLPLLLYHHLYSAETKICKYCPSECCVLQERCTEWIECSRPGENDWDCNFIFYQPRYAGLLFLCQECTVCNQGERKSSGDTFWTSQPDLNMQVFAKEVMEKVRELDAEKMKTEKAFHDFLPTSVVRDMKRSKVGFLEVNWNWQNIFCRQR